MVDPNYVVKKRDGKDVEVQDGWKGRILPFDRVQLAHHKKELDALRKKEAELSEVIAQLEELLEGFSDEDKAKDTFNEAGDKFVAAAVAKEAKEAKELAAEGNAPDAFDAESYEAKIIQAAEVLAREKSLKAAIKKDAAALHLKTKAKIDADYMNSRFAKYLKELQSGDGPSKEATLAELHRSFTSLSQEDQRFAEIFLHDIQRGDVQIHPARTFRDYLVAYKARAKKKDVAAIVAALGVNPKKLAALMETHVTEVNINEYGRFDDLRGTIDAQRAKHHFERVEGRPLPMFKINIRAANLLRDFLIRGAL